MEGGEELGFEFADSVVERLDNSILDACFGFRKRFYQVFERDWPIASVCRLHRFRSRKRSLVRCAPLYECTLV